MQGFIDFVNFKFFISPYVLIVFYYIGAIAVPVASWLFASWVIRKFSIASDIYESGKTPLKNITRKKDRMLLFALFVLFFIFMEIMWRMMFEFLIAYLQMREALMELALHG
jgi:hypothetical protein